MDTKRVAEIISEIYRLVAKLEAMFEGRHCTPDGHMVGSLGEAYAAHHFGLELQPASTTGHDAVMDGKSVEIKATQGESVAFRSSPQHALVFKINRDGTFSQVYNGPGEHIWATFARRAVSSNGQFQIRIKKLKKLDELVR